MHTTEIRCNYIEYPPSIHLTYINPCSAWWFTLNPVVSGLSSQLVVWALTVSIKPTGLSGKVLVLDQNVNFGHAGINFCLLLGVNFSKQIVSLFTCSNYKGPGEREQSL